MNKDFTQIENKKLAGFWRRFLAYALDYIMASSIVSVTLLIFLFLYKTIDIKVILIISGILFAISFILYYVLLAYTRVYLQVKTGQSWGKKFMGLYILSDNDKKMSWGQAIGRIFMHIPASCTFLIAWIMMVFRKDKKTLSDIVVGTKVYMLEDAKYKNRIWISILILIANFIIVIALMSYAMFAIFEDAGIDIFGNNSNMYDPSLEYDYRYEFDNSNYYDQQTMDERYEYDNERYEYDNERYEYNR